MAAFAARWKRLRKRSSEAIAGPLAVGAFTLLRRGDLDRVIDRAGRLMRRLGPHLREHQVGRANLATAFPEKSAGEIEHLALAAWEQVGRYGGEFAQIDRLCKDAGNRFEHDAADLARVQRVRDAGAPVVLFGAHIGNWELPQVWTTANGLDTAVVFRAPSLPRIAALAHDLRKGLVGELIPTSAMAPIQAAAWLERGKAVHILADQYSYRGVDVDFFGRPCKATAMVARLARHYECPIHGYRCVRLPGNRFRMHFTDAIVPPRGEDGRIDIAGTTQVLASIMEGWVREHPEQWLWFHRRWR
jgi:KDO2-lipid IV(A) lauroyltransferase